MQEAILHGDLITRVNTSRAPYDNRKLPAWLETAFTAALNAAHTTNAAVQLAAGSQAGAAGRVSTAFDRLAGLARNAHSHIESFPDDDVPPEDKLAALVSLGFEQGELGQLADPDHLFGIIGDILANNAALPALLRVPVGTMNRITNWKGVYDANQELAGGGPREVLTNNKNDAKDLLLARIARVRLYLCACSDLGEQDPEIARYDFQPKRAPGDAQPQPKPDAPGTFTWDGTTRTGTVPALPAHATLMVGWRQILGGEPEPCGISETGEVNFAETAPFLPAGHYKLWMTGRNSEGDGPKSNVIDWTAPN